MDTKGVQEGGYTVEQLKLFRKKRIQRRILKGIPYLLTGLVLVYFAASHVAKLPRERYARNFGFLQRVQLGAQRALSAAYLTIAAEHEDGAKTQLSTAEIYIRGKRIDRLNEHLPVSGRESQKAKFRYAGKALKVDVRYRGDSMNHWAFPQKSWRVELRKRDAIDGMRTLNLNVPRSNNQLANWLGYELARRLGGLLVPDSEMVHFRLNRNFDGIRLLLEQPNQDFLLRRNLAPGKIFIGDISSEQIYGTVPRERLYSKANAWSVRAPTEDVGAAELASLLRILGVSDTYRLYYKLQKLVDVEAFLRYIALLEFVGSVHIDDTHNGKMYFNPDSGKFMPIVWDTVSYFWGNNKALDIGSNGLFRAILSVPAFRERKDEILSEMVAGDFSEDAITLMIRLQADRIRKDVHAFPLKIHANDKGAVHISNAEWEAAVEKLLANVAARNNKIRKHLATTGVRFALKKSDEEGVSELWVVNDGTQAVVLEQLAVKSEGDLTIERIGLEQLLKHVEESARLIGTKRQGDKRQVVLNDTLISGRSFAKGARAIPVAAPYRYRIKAQDITSDSIVLTLKTKTGDNIEATEDESLLAGKVEGFGWMSPDRFLADTVKTLSGKVQLTESLILDDYTRLQITPGTEISLAAGVSILVRGGGVEAVGTPERPIVVRATSGVIPWGVFAVQGGSAKMAHVKFIGGGEGELQHVWYGAPVSLHNAEVDLKAITLKDSRINFVSSKGSLQGLRYEGIHARGYTVQRSQIRAVEIEKLGYEPLHVTARYKSGEFFGTPARTEREFKYSLTGNKVQSLSLDEVSALMHDALGEAVKDKDRWSAPQLTGTAYYHDDASKDFLFRDIYFDTADFLNYNNQVSYRYRNRYKGAKQYETHLRRPTWPDYWPYRLEFQAKVNRQELGDGFSTVDESRFEFRSASSPFSESNLPPPPPWIEEEFVPYFEAGHYLGMPTTAAKAIVDFLSSKGYQADSFKFVPKNVLVTDRFRQHFNIKTKWGSGPNPDQAYIISLDRSRVYDAKEYLEYLKRKRLGYKKLAQPIERGVIVEVELEFERNVSEKLDAQIALAEQEGNMELKKTLEETRAAFLSDQKMIMQVLKEQYAKVGIGFEPASKSKYGQAVDLMQR